MGVQAAGRPSSSVSISTGIGRKHYVADDASAAQLDRSSPPSVSAYADSGADLVQAAGRPSSSVSISTGIGRKHYVADDASAAQLDRSSPPSYRHQFSARSRIGHGNILTWESQAGAMEEPKMRSLRNYR